MDGSISKVNLQSGVTRERSKELTWHSGPITGIVCDVLNRIVVTVSMDGNLKVWDFFKLKLIKCLEIGDGVLGNLVKDGGNLFCFTSSSLNLYVYDFHTMKCIRRFESIANNAITSLCFSHDSKWIVTASMDKSLKVWDLLTATLIDWIVFLDIPMAVAFSPTGEYLTTTHVNKKGKIRAN